MLPGRLHDPRGAKSRNSGQVSSGEIVRRIIQDVLYSLAGYPALPDCRFHPVT
jgi:hypothetical protein